MEVKDLIHTKRIEHGMTMKDLAKAVGVSEGTISRWESGRIENMRRDKIAKLSEVLDIPVEDLMEWEKRESLPSNVSVPAAHAVPILGVIGCGEGPLGQENFAGYFFIDHSIHADYCLQCKGDSMIGAGINDGDYVFLDKDFEIEDGKVYAVVFGADDEAVLKKLYRADGKVILQSENEKYPPIVLDRDEVHVIGELAWICHKVEK